MSKRIACMLLVMVLVLSCSVMAVYAVQPDRTFIYDEGSPVPSTNIYKVKRIVEESVMGCTRMNEPTDMFVDSEDRTFILDSGNCRVLVLDKDFRCIKELTEFKYEGNTIKLKEGAQGLFFRESNQKLYIADTENNRIIVTDLDGNASKVYLKPVGEMLDEGKSYKPTKIIVDNMGIMYVLSGTVNTGALMVDSANNFLGFYGINQLKMTAAMKLEFFWRSILTDAMNAKSEESFQPAEFLNLFWSEDRFVYAVSPALESMDSTVVKLNSLGKNVFPQKIDFLKIEKDSNIRNRVLADITVDQEGVFTIIDRTTGCLYQYDENCNMLAVFGGKGYQKGMFTAPVALECDSSNNLLVLDATKCSITIMEQTYYGQMIRSANYLFNHGMYQESIEPWMDVLRMNANYIQAYVGLGKAYIGMGEYEKAMEYFKIGKDQGGYAEAKAALRDETVREYFGLIAAVVVLAMISILGYDEIKALFYKIQLRMRKKGDER